MSAASDAPASSPSAAPAAPRRRGGRRILLAVLLLVAALAALVLLAPTILSLGPAREYALARASKHLGLRLSADAWSLSWWGAQEIRGLVVEAADGSRAARIDMAALDQGLGSLVRDPRHIGRVRVDGAEVWTGPLRRVIDEASKSLAPEAAPAAPPGPPQPPQPPTLPLAIDLRNATLHAGAATLTVAEFTFAGAPDDDALHAFNLVLTEPPGRATLKGTIEGLRRGFRGWTDLGVRAAVHADDVQLAGLWAIAKDFGVPLQGGGKMSLDAAVHRARTGQVEAQVACTGADVWIADPAPGGGLLGGDRPTLASLRLRADGRSDGRTFTVSALELESPVATAQAVGTFTLGAADAETPTGKGHAKVQLNLARLAAMLPSTLRIHKEVTVEGGTLEGAVEAASGRDLASVKAIVEIRDLRGVREGRRIALSPGRLVIEAEQARAAEAESPVSKPRPTYLDDLAGLRLKSFVTTGAFGRISAAGRLEALTLDAQLDLAKASDEVARFVALGVSAAGEATVHLETEGRLDQAVRVRLRTDAKDLVLDLGRGLRWTEPQLTLEAAGAAKLDGRLRPTEGTLDTLTYYGPGLRLTAAGAVAPADGATTFRGKAKADGQVARLASLAQLVCDVTSPAAPSARAASSPPAAPDAADWRRTVRDLARRMMPLPGQADAGRWSLDASADGTLGRTISAEVSLAAEDVTVQSATAATAANSPRAAVPAAAPPAPARAMRIPRASVQASVRYDEGPASALHLSGLALVFPGLQATLKGAMTIPLGGTPLAFEGNATGRVAADLAALAETLSPLGLMPEGVQAAGLINLDFHSTTVPGKATGGLTLAARGLDLRWAGGRRLAESELDLAADLAVLRDAASRVTQVDITSYRLKAAPGQVTGTATLTPGPAGAPAWTVQVDGAGSLAPLSRTVAGLLGREASVLRGEWKVAGAARSDAAGARTIDLAATATNLAIPQPGDPPRPDLRLADAKIDASVLMEADGRLVVRKADVSGPGLALRASGTARLPTKANPDVTADGAVALRATLTDLATALEPFGVLPTGLAAAGTAAFDGKVTSSAAGVSGAGTLDLSDLDVRLPEDGLALAEPKAHVPLTAAWAAKERRWDITIADMTSSLVNGSVRASVAVPEGRPADVRAALGLTVDAAKLRALLGKHLPQAIQLGGFWRASASVAGPLPAEGAWHRRAAGLTGEGTIEVARFEADKLVAGDGAVRFRLADGQLVASPDPAQPSRLKVAGGTATLAGRVDLRGAEPRLVIDRPLALLADVPLSDPGIKEYLKFGSPVLAMSIDPEGKAFLEIDSLDLPLAEGGPNRAVGAGRFWIDRFQTELTGPLARLLQAYQSPTRTPVQTFGPVPVRLAAGVFHIDSHQLVFSEDTVLKFTGRIGLDRRLDFVVDIPLTEPMLRRFGVSASAVPYLVGQRLTLPLTGTIDKPVLDEKIIAKRLGEMALEALKRKALEDLGGFLKKGLKKK